MSSRIYIPPSYSDDFAHSASESAFPSLWKGMVGAWVPALGPTGETVFDVSGFGQRRDGTLGVDHVATDWAIAVNTFGFAAYSLDTTDTSTGDKSIIVGDVPEYDFTNGEFSIVVRAQPESADPIRDARLVFHEEAVGNTGWNLMREEGATGFRYRVDETVSIFSNTGVIADGVPFHAVVNITGGDVFFWVNGKDETPGTNAIVAPSAGTQTLVLGGDSVAINRQWNGLIWEVRLYNRPLTDNEIQIDYRNPLAPLILRSRLFVKSPDVVVPFSGELNNPIFRVKPRGYGHLREAA